VARAWPGATKQSRAAKAANLKFKMVGFNEINPNSKTKSLQKGFYISTINIFVCFVCFWFRLDLVYAI